MSIFGNADALTHPHPNSSPSRGIRHLQVRGGRGAAPAGAATGHLQPPSKNRQWVNGAARRSHSPSTSADGRWERGGHVGRGRRGRGASTHLNGHSARFDDGDVRNGVADESMPEEDVVEVDGFGDTASPAVAQTLVTNGQEVTKTWEEVRFLCLIYEEIFILRSSL